MQFDDQLRRYFGSDDLEAITPEALGGGIEQMRVDLGLERDPDRRFALWALLCMLGAAPELVSVFTTDGELDAARNFMDYVDEQDDAEAN